MMKTISICSPAEFLRLVQYLKLHDDRKINLGNYEVILHPINDDIILKHMNDVFIDVSNISFIIETYIYTTDLGDTGDRFCFMSADDWRCEFMYTVRSVGIEVYIDASSLRMRLISDENKFERDITYMRMLMGHGEVFGNHSNDIEAYFT